jgi:hypothetical protein
MEEEDVHRMLKEFKNKFKLNGEGRGWSSEETQDKTRAGAVQRAGGSTAKCTAQIVGLSTQGLLGREAPKCLPKKVTWPDSHFDFLKISSYRMEKNIETMLLLRALFLHLQNKENRKHLL